MSSVDGVLTYQTTLEQTYSRTEAISWLAVSVQTSSTEVGSFFYYLNKLFINAVADSLQSGQVLDIQFVE